MITVDANLFRIAAFAVSDDETRYYLRGVHLEPHPAGGVIMTATSGHVLTTVHDETGTMSGAPRCTVGLPSKVLASCKPKGGKSAPSVRRLEVDVENDLAVVRCQQTSDEIARAYRVVVDGTFPDWRRVVPSPKSIGGTPAQFLPPVLAVLSATATALSAPLMLTGDDDDCALVNYGNRPHVVSLAMPCRKSAHANKAARPYWL